MADTSHSSCRDIVAGALSACAIVLAISAPAHAQTVTVPPAFDPEYFNDTLRADSVVIDSLAVDSALADTLVADSAIYDSAYFAALAKAAEDTTWKRFLPPGQWRTSEQRHLDALIAGPSWPMPPVDAIAGGDLADWLSYHPAYDVDDGPGVGQTRFFTHWGSVDRQGTWSVDDRPASWQRLTFPMTPQFDPAILPSYDFATVRFGEDVMLKHDTPWREEPVFDFTFLQGDFSDTYSEGRFRAHTKRGFGMDLSGTFFSSDGRFATDTRDKRILALELFGPLKKHYYWRARYSQFRDKSLVLTPEPFDFLRPARNDLLWSGELAVARLGDSIQNWQFGARFTSGHQRLGSTSYSIASEDRDWQLFGETQIAGWDVSVRGGLEELEIDSTNVERWYTEATGSQKWQLSEMWAAALRINLSDWDTDPPSLGAAAVLAPAIPSLLSPSLRLSRERAVPTLFDRNRPLAEYSIIDLTQTGYLYSEAGDPSLDDQWENSVSLQWGRESIDDSARFALTVGGHVAYIENYTRWQGSEDLDTLLGNSVFHYRYRPISEDARSYGAALGIHGRLFWKFHYLTHYAVKYATDLDNVKLTGYYPHKGVAMLSLIAPKWKYGVDLRLNAAGLWWYGDTRIDPTGYESSHALRLDLSGSARVVGDLTLYALMQNVANFPYRTAAGYPFTGRTVRFGLHVTLYN